MKKTTFQLLERYMQQCAGDSAHDAQHVYRVLYQALAIAKTEPETDMDILIAACLLHDIGRPEQHADSSVCHAQAGAEKAYRFLRENGFSEEFARHVEACVLTHRFRKSRPPESLEARILFDADKLDVVGAMGIARTIQFGAHTGGQMYTLLPDGTVSDGSGEYQHTLFHEYRYKLEKLYDRFYTAEGKRLALQRQESARQVYESLLAEVSFSYAHGPQELQQLLT